MVTNSEPFRQREQRIAALRYATAAMTRSNSLAAR